MVSPRKVIRTGELTLRDLNKRKVSKFLMDYADLRNSYRQNKRTKQNKNKQVGGPRKPPRQLKKTLVKPAQKKPSPISKQQKINMLPKSRMQPISHAARNRVRFMRDPTDYSIDLMPSDMPLVRYSKTRLTATLSASAGGGQFFVFPACANDLPVIVYRTTTPIAVPSTTAPLSGYLNVVPTLLPYSLDSLISPGLVTSNPNLMNTSLLTVKPRCIAIGMKITPLASQAENQGAMRVLIDHGGSVVLSNDPESILGTRVYPLNSTREVDVPIMFEHRQKRGMIVHDSSTGNQYQTGGAWGSAEFYPTAETYLREYTDATTATMMQWNATSVGSGTVITIPNYNTDGVADTGTPTLGVNMPSPVAAVTFKGTSTTVAVSYRVELVIHMSYETRSQITLPLVPGAIIEPKVRSALDHLLEAEERESGKTWAERARSAWDAVESALDSDTAWYVRRLIQISMEDRMQYPRITGGLS